MSKAVGFGNCQTNGMARCAAATLGVEAIYLRDPELLVEAIQEATVVFATAGNPYTRAREVAASAGRPDLAVIPAPRFYFSGFHPDMVVPVGAGGNQPDLPMGQANSAIVLAAWREELDLKQVIGLFRDEVYEALGYYQMYGMATDALVEECARTGFDVQPLMGRWLERGAFAYTPNHPKIRVIEDITSTQLQLHKLLDGKTPLRTPSDDLAFQGVWPVYREIGERLGIPGDYIFRPKKGPGMTIDEAAPFDLETFVERAFSSYGRCPPDFTMFPRLDDPRLQQLRRFVKTTAAALPGNPYKQLSASHWWSKSVADPPPEEVDPVVRTKFTIGKHDRVATAGSCFAQHIAKRLAASGFNYFVTEKAPPECSNPVAEDYGVFTARFGNIYTVRQLLQLADRAYGNFEPAIEAWEVPGGYVDPFRPRIGGTPFSSLEALRAARETHFAAVREMFESADIFVFTLGLTEAWASKKDGAVVPLPPGVLSANVPPDSYLPKNFTVGETIADLRSLVRLLQARNPTVRILLTVSPVPLIATYEPKHVLEATTHSKSVLRAAAGEIADSSAHVAYFPSYEIVTGSFNRGRYFAEDLRQVTEAGVNHVMKLFLSHYGGLGISGIAAEKTGGPPDLGAERFRSETKWGMDVVCDEEEIESSAAGGA